MAYSGIFPPPGAVETRRMGGDLNKSQLIFIRADVFATLRNRRPCPGSYHCDVTGAGGNGAETSAAAGAPAPENAAKTIDSGANPGSLVSRLRAWRESIRRRPTAYRVYRAGVGVVGGAIVIAGLALVPLPGPGWVLVFAGLAVLATEFVWADRLEKFARNQLTRWTNWLNRQPVWVRGAFGVLVLAFVLCVLYALFALAGVPGWIPDSWVPGLG